ncbi:MAG: methionyl-tRNA formyltransferase [Prevotellaceae bacterium]|jgi:methionyl-tRNA formyltransferase|nr:methionyl-tRNA formyltransferase [Prevotellaceae bacterium]
MTDSKSTRIVFMGTPEFAAFQLQALMENGYKVVGVVTTPDKLAGRGMQLQSSAVKQYALTQNLPILQPAKLKNQDFVDSLQALQADIFVVVAFRMLPEVVWQMPRLGAFNLHASLLPQYRGAAPINWAVINGEKASGVTTFLIDKEVDTGKILLRKTVEILPADDAGTLHDKLMQVGPGAIIQTIDGLTNKTLHPVAQESPTELKSAPKLFKDNTRIGWSENADEVVNFIRGLSPYPAAWSNVLIAGEPAPQMVKIYKAHAELCQHGSLVGDVVVADNGIKVACANGFVHIDELQLAGKKRIPTADFLRGFRGVFQKMM